MEVKDEKTHREDEALVGKPKLDLDRVLKEEIGQYGRYQMKTQAISAIFVMFLAIMANEYIFTAPRVRTRCLIPECESTNSSDITNGTGDDFSPSWLPHVLPFNEDGNLENCRRYASNGSTDLLASNESCPANIFDFNKTVPCEVYVYENKDSAVYDFNLACDEWRRSMIGSVSTFGTVFAHPLTGFISDRWGRRSALAFNFLNSGLFGLTRYWTNSYYTLLITQFCGSIFSGGISTCVYILVMETVGPKYRVMAGALSSTSIVMGQVLLVIFAWALPNWRNRTLAIYITQLLSLPLIFLMTESVRWYIGKGKFEKAERVLINMAHTNGRQLSTNTLLILRESIKSEKEQKSDIEEENEEWLIVQVFRHKAMFLRCCVSPVQWITLTLTYFGLSINAVNITTGGKFINYLTVCMCEIPGYWIAVITINRIGRKPVLAGGYWTCALAMLVYIIVPTGYRNLSLVLYMLGKCGISTVVVALYLHTSEIYPTKYRHRLFAFSSMMGRFGSIIAPLTPAFGGNIPFLMFGIMGLVSGLLVLLTPETRGCQLLETMEDAVNIGKRRNSHSK